MSATYPQNRFAIALGMGRFAPAKSTDIGAAYGPTNAAEVTKVFCPVCHRPIWVPRGQFDTLHNCTIMCPWEANVTMKPIVNPAQTVPRILPQTATQLIQDGWKRFFYYCPSPKCPYLIANGVAYMQRRVQVDILVGR